jgi:hypothetical protein
MTPFFSTSNEVGGANTGSLFAESCFYGTEKREQTSAISSSLPKKKMNVYVVNLES